MTKKPLWEGRLEGRVDPFFRSFGASISFDKRLWREDIAVNRASLEALKKAQLVTPEEYERLLRALEELSKAFEEGKISFSEELEDIHMHVEAALTERAGEVAGKIHTGRSRNDQVATDMRLFVKKACRLIIAQLNEVLATLADRSEQTLAVILPAYTHLQRAQPVLLAHWFVAYAEMFLRDRRRFAFAAEQADALPLGAGAGTGNPFDLDQETLRRHLGFARLCRNSLDAVSDRDFVLDFCYAAAVLMVHLSRLCEDIILYASAEFGFFTLPEALSTGSSMMPQKRNPDSAELVRGKSSRVAGDLTSLLLLLKGLPLTYHKDMQEDKERLFDAFDTASACLGIIKRLLASVRIDTERCRKALQEGFLEATAVADYLTRKGVPFRTAYRITGRIVADLAQEGGSFKDMTLQQWRSYAPQFENDIQEAITPEAMVAARRGVGGTAPEAVRREIERVRAEAHGQTGTQELSQGEGGT